MNKNLFNRLKNKIKPKILIKALFSILVIFIMIAVIIYPDRYLKSTIEGLKLWAFSVLPSLLPFFFLTAVLTGLEIFSSSFKKADNFTIKLLNQPGVSLYAFIISVLSGYPVGSRTVADLYEAKLLSSAEATKASVLASTSSPLFIIGAIGTATFSNKFYGFILFISHVLSAVMVAFTFKNYGDKATPNQGSIKSNKVDNLLHNAVYTSVISTLTVGGYIAVFYVFSEVLFDFKILTPLSNLINLILSPITNKNLGEGIVTGLIECTKGCHLLSKQGANLFTLPLTAFLISFGGFSIIAQSLTFLSKCKVKPTFFILAKLLQGVYAFILSFAIFYFVL